MKLKVKKKKIHTRLTAISNYIVFTQYIPNNPIFPEMLIQKDRIKHQTIESETVSKIKNYLEQSKMSNISGY